MRSLLRVDVFDEDRQDDDNDDEEKRTTTTTMATAQFRDWNAAGSRR